jgi:hypothetical protein
MPHAVLSGSIDLHAFAAAHAPFQIRDAQGVHAATGIYVAPDGRRALLEASAQAYGRTRRYLLSLQRREAHGREELVVGLADVEGPAITPGLILLIEELARRVLAQAPSARVLHTNLPRLGSEGTSEDAGSSQPGPGTTPEGSSRR